MSVTRFSLHADVKNQHENRSLVPLMFLCFHLTLLLLFPLFRGGSVLLSTLPHPSLLRRLLWHLHPSSVPSNLRPVWTPPPQPLLLSSGHSPSVTSWSPPLWALPTEPHPLPPCLPLWSSPVRPHLRRCSTSLLCSGGAGGKSSDPPGGGLPSWRGGRGSVQDGGQTAPSPGSSQSLRQLSVSTAQHGAASHLN